MCYFSKEEDQYFEEKIISLRVWIFVETKQTHVNKGFDYYYQ